MHIHPQKGKIATFLRLTCQDLNMHNECIIYQRQLHVAYQQAGEWNNRSMQRSYKEYNLEGQLLKWLTFHMES